MHYYDLTVTQAEDLRSWVEASGPARLAELAEWVDTSGGPLSRLDGSFASLVPLWEWFVHSCDTNLEDIVGRDKRPFEELVMHLSVESPRPAHYASETLSHYVFQVFKGIDPDTRWTVFYPPRKSRVLDNDTHRTGIATLGTWNWLDPRLGSITRRVLSGNTVSRSPAELRDLVTTLFDGGDDIRGSSSPAFSLADYLGCDQTAPPFPPSLASIHTSARRDEPEPFQKQAPVVFMARSTPEAFREIDHFLRTLGAKTAGNDRIFLAFDEGVFLEVEDGSDGAVSLSVEAIAASQDDWGRLVAGYNKHLAAAGFEAFDGHTSDPVTFNAQLYEQ